nr:copia protein [Tanacetum cinerariifolium]
MENLPKVGKTNALSNPVTSNSVSTPQESKGMNNDKVIAPGMFRINPDKTSREAKKVPNTVRASNMTKPITVSQPHVITKKDVNSDLNGLSSTGIDNTKTRRPQPRSNTKNDKVPSASKSSRSQNKEDEVEEHHRNLLSYRNNKHISSACNNIKIDSQDVISKFVCAICCSKHMTGNLKLLINFVWKFLGTVRFRNDHVAAILGFGNLKWGNILITRVYFVEGLGHNLFSVGQFCDSDLVVAFRRNDCFVKNLEGVDLLKGDQAARTMLIFSRASFFLWDEAIATACFTQNRSIIHRQFNKTPYELINGKKLDISFLHVFDALCYPKNDREDIGKLGAKGDIGFFIGYSADSCAYRVYNRRTKKIMETINVSFDELSAMAFEQCSLKPELNSMTSGHISSGLDLTYAPSTITMQQPSEGELDLLFEAMYDDYIGGQPSATARTVPPAQEPQVRQSSTASTTVADTAPIPTISSSHAINIPITPQDVDELNLNAMVDGNTFVNLFTNSSTNAAASSSHQNVDPLNMHTFYQPYPHEFQWTKDHPLEQAKPTEKHLKEDKQIFRYLRGTVNTGLWYSKDSGFELTGFSDADYAGCKDTFKSTSGGAQFLGEKLVSWSSKTQDCTALSTMEAKYVSLSACCAQVLWMRTQLTDHGFHFNKILIYCDSKSAIAISCNPVQHSRTKHIAVCYHFIKEHVEKGTIELYFVKTDYQLDDIFTKALPTDRFNYLVRHLGMRSLSPEELDHLEKSQ